MNWKEKKMDFNDVLKEFYNNISHEEKELYKKLSEKAIDLEYFPKKEKTKKFNNIIQ